MTYTIIDDDNHEWADAPTLEDAEFACRTLATEERKAFRAVDEDGKVLVVAVVVEKE